MSDTNRNHDERIRHLEAELALLKRNAKPYERTVSGPWKDYTQGVYAHTFFDDLQYQLIGQNMTSPAARIAYSVNRDYVKFPKTCDWNDDWLTMVIQMSHRWKVGTAIYPHIHWIQAGEKTPNFLVGWLWQVNGATTATTWDYLIPSANAFSYSSGNLNQITKFNKITPPAGAGLSDLVHIKLFRDVANESTEFTGAEDDAKTQDDAYANSFDIHFEIDTAGSREEYVK